MRTTTTCDCGRPASERVLVSTIPGSLDGKLVWLALCRACYEREGWAESRLNLTPEQDVWELALRPGGDA